MDGRGSGVRASAIPTIPMVRTKAYRYIQNLGHGRWKSNQQFVSLQRDARLPANRACRRLRIGQIRPVVLDET
jgi:hypothetical protein